MEKSVTVHILGKPYSLRVEEKDEALTREIASYVDGKMTAFRRQFPKQAESTSAVIVALALAEELFTLREKNDSLYSTTNKELEDLSDLLESALDASASNGTKKKGKSKVEDE